MTDIVIARRSRRAAGAGTWVGGRVGGYRFEALVFPEHADDPSWEIGRSKISKLWVQRSSDERMVFNWDRGEDVPTADLETQEVVDLLAARLADLIFPGPPPPTHGGSTGRGAEGG
jgi:hypothetical protein